MSCCGQQRRAVRERFAGARRAPQIPPPAEALEAVPLDYRGEAPLTLRGPVSGAVYSTGPAGARVLAHPGDAAALLATGLFAPAADAPDK
jgi:hypothetical protein